MVVFRITFVVSRGVRVRRMNTRWFVKRFIFCAPVHVGLHGSQPAAASNRANSLRSGCDCETAPKCLSRVGLQTNLDRRRKAEHVLVITIVNAKRKSLKLLKRTPGYLTSLEKVCAIGHIYVPGLGSTLKFTRNKANAVPPE